MGTFWAFSEPSESFSQAIWELLGAFWELLGLFWEPLVPWETLEASCRRLNSLPRVHWETAVLGQILASAQTFWKQISRAFGGPSAVLLNSPSGILGKLSVLGCKSWPGAYLEANF